MAEPEPEITPPMTQESVDAGRTREVPTSDVGDIRLAEPATDVDLVGSDVLLDKTSTSDDSSGKKDARARMFPTFQRFFPLYGYPSKDFLLKQYGWMEILSGVTVALAQLPEAIAWPLLAGLDVSIGLSASWMMALITSLFGGRPAMVSGATGSTAVLMVTLVQTHGVGHLFYAVMLSGILQIICYFLNAGKILRLISKSVVIGFVNGLGLVIFVSQFESFKKCSGAALGDETNTECYDPHHSSSGGHNTFTTLVGGTWLDASEIGYMCILVAVTMVATLFIPRISLKLPAALIGIGISAIIEWAVFRPAGVPTRTIGEISQVEPRFPIPIWFSHEQYIKTVNGTTVNVVTNPFTSETAWPIITTAISIALVGTVESLLTEQLIDEKTNTQSNPTQEFLGQGLGNLLSGMTGGMGGCAMIGQSMVNIETGARTRVSTIVAAIVTFIILMAGKILDIIPIAGLVGVMFIVVYRTIEWSSFGVILISCMPLCVRNYIMKNGWLLARKIHRGDVLIIVAVTVVTLFFDLGIAVGVGVFLTTLFYSWDSGDSIEVTSKEVLVDTYDMKKEDDTSEGPCLVKKYEIDGPLCFSSVPRFLDFFENCEQDPQYVELHFHQSTLFGYSAIDAMNKLGDRYEALGKQLVIRRVRHKCNRTLAKAKNLHGTGFVLREEVTEMWDGKAKKPDHHYELHCSHGTFSRRPSHQDSGDGASRNISSSSLRATEPASAPQRRHRSTLAAEFV